MRRVIAWTFVLIDAEVYSGYVNVQGYANGTPAKGQRILTSGERFMDKVTLEYVTTGVVRGTAMISRRGVASRAWAYA